MRDQEALLEQGLDQLKEMERMGDTDGLGSQYDSFGGSLEGSLTKSLGSFTEEKKEGLAVGSTQAHSFDKGSNKSCDEKKDEDGKKEGDDYKGDINEQETRLVDEQMIQERENIATKIK